MFRWQIIIFLDVRFSSRSVEHNVDSLGGSLQRELCVHRWSFNNLQASSWNVVMITCDYTSYPTCCHVIRGAAPAEFQRSFDREKCLIADSGQSAFATKTSEWKLAINVAAATDRLKNWVSLGSTFSLILWQCCTFDLVILGPKTNRLVWGEDHYFGQHRHGWKLSEGLILMELL